MTVNKPIIFLGGLILGASSGVLATMTYFKNKYSAIADQQIAEMEEYYQRTDEYSRISPLPEDNAEINPVNENGEPDRSNGVLSQEKRDEIKQKLLDNYARTSNNATNYAAISKEMFENKRAEAESDGADDEDESNEMTPEEEADEEHKANFNKPPRIISLEEYNSLPAYINTETLYFWHYDEILTDDDENEIDDPGRLIGDALTKYDFIDSDESVIFVMNYQTDTAYEVQRVMGSFRDQEV